MSRRWANYEPDFSRYVEKSTENLTPQPPSLGGKGENSKPLSLQERGLERGFPDAVKGQNYEPIKINAPEYYNSTTN